MHNKLIKDNKCLRVDLGMLEKIDRLYARLKVLERFINAN